ncbi:MAG: undecaprenyl diphosphate synthase family protein [Myxococcota bacterium]|jgi:undecaprenyl diphosphate synthase|nr:undecaprenyl diphosphate synthase family protein [Myxococcota bacterium]
MSNTASGEAHDTEVSAGNAPCSAAPLHVALLLAPEGATPPGSSAERRYSPAALCDAVLELQASGVKELTLSAFGELSCWACREFPSEARRFSDFLAYATPCLVASGVRVTALGNIEELPSSLRHSLDYLADATREARGMALRVLVSYAARADVIETARHLGALVRAGLLLPEDIDEQVFRERMQAARVSNFDLCICSEGAIPAHELFPFQGAGAESVEISADAEQLSAELDRVLCESAGRDGSEAPTASGSRLRPTNFRGARLSANGRGA